VASHVAVVTIVQVVRYGAAGNAAALDAAADQLEDAFRSDGDDLLTVAQAAAESGYSADHIGRELRSGHVPNAGRPRAPRIRRADLPRKPGIALPNRAGRPTLSGARGRMAATVVHSELGH
jgi:hypothetical protein